ncbi:MORN repeat-containing protein 2 isoform X3 [Melanotaenia boesemani]|uniref:MORN repeat-containing protein 2 isoform X3 n=1 Tax=Melanotaenia boesemani TaxID=1250792 RepID=UPI001C04CE0B|nr:MORN repeat-containing protein 2 isoform X3 [Melanotaenia boesemani]
MKLSRKQRLLSALTTICQPEEAVTDVWWEDGPRKVFYIFPNGERYEGECSRSAGVLVRSGTGKHISVTGVIYTGEWCKDKMQGRGTLEHPSGAVYEGEFKDGMYHGMGTYTFPDGCVYKGPFKNNRIEGDGTFIDAKGIVWTGEFHGKAALGLKMQHNI